MIFLEMKTDRKMMLTLFASLVLFCSVLQANTVRIFSLSADAWARPRSGQILPQLEPVRLAVAYWETGTDAAIMLSYPGEDSGEIWASELKDWLISLGISSDYILLSKGLQAEDEINILVGNRRELIP
jgi:hypothetical protein